MKPVVDYESLAGTARLFYRLLLTPRGEDIIMLKYIAPSFIIVSCMMHMFCCGIPLLLSVTSLGTVLGISSASMFEFEWFEAIEHELFITSGTVLAATIIAHIISRRLNCYEDARCCDAPCDEKKSLSFYLLIGASVLYVVNLVTVLAG